MMAEKIRFMIRGMISGSRPERYHSPMQALRGLIALRAERQAKPNITAVGDDYQVCRVTVSKSGKAVPGEWVDMERYEEALRQRAAAVGYRPRELGNTAAMADYESKIITQGRLGEQDDYLAAVFGPGKLL